MKKIITLPVTLLLVAGWPTRAEAEEKKAVYFWIQAKDGADFPGEILEVPGLLPAASLKDIIDYGKEKTPLPNHYEDDIINGVDYFFSNRFMQSESTLGEAWRELIEAKENYDVSARLILKCFVFRMLNFKVKSKIQEAYIFAREAAGYIDPKDIETIDISPDGLKYITSLLASVSPSPYEISISLPSDANDCSISIDGITRKGLKEKIKFSGKSHWISTTCEGSVGWNWAVNFPQHHGRTLLLDPEAESQCLPASPPAVVCGKLTEGTLKIGSNLLDYPGIYGFYILKPSQREGPLGVEISQLLTDRETKAPDITWHWKPLPEESLPNKKTQPLKREKTVINKTSLALAVAGVGVAGLSGGLLGWSEKIKTSTHTIEDPWKRRDSEKKAKDIENASIALFAVAASLLITSITYHVIYYKKRKGKNESK